MTQAKLDAPLSPDLASMKRPTPSDRQLRVALLGTRGIPAEYGGFETFAARIAPLLVQRHGIEVTVIGDASMRASDGMVGNVRVQRSRFDKSKSPLRFYWESLGMASKFADIALVCGTPGGGLAFRTPKKMLVATNPDGLESRRGKWSWPVRQMFVASEKAATHFSDALLCDSAGIEKYYRKRHGAKNTFVAAYGACPNPFLDERAAELSGVLAKEGLQAGGYHLVVARLEPENNLHLIVEAYRRVAAQLRHPLYILSNRRESVYATQLMASPPEGVVFYGPVFEAERLDALRAGAASYVHGHTVGGTNPSLVEAMASRNLCLCHDNEFNRATSANQALFFRNEEELGAHLIAAEQESGENVSLAASAHVRWQEHYTWEQISDDYAAALRSMIEQGAGA